MWREAGSGLGSFSSQCQGSWALLPNMYLRFILSKTPSPALRFVLSVQFYRRFQKSPLCLWPSCLCSFVPFSCSRCCYHRAPLELAAPSGFSCFFWGQIVTSGTGKLSFPPCLALFVTHKVPQLLLCAEKPDYSPKIIIISFLRNISLFVSGDFQSPLLLCCWQKPKQWFPWEFFPVLQWTFCFMEPGQCWVLGGGSWTAILLKSTQISWWLISSTENEYRSVFRCLNWKFFM